MKKYMNIRSVAALVAVLLTRDLAGTRAVGQSNEYIVTDLGTLGGSASHACGINNNGDIVGWSFVGAPSAGTRAFLYKNGVMRSLGTLGAGGSFGYAISESGDAVGVAGTSGTIAHAFRYSNGAMIDLGTLGLRGANSTSGANAINSQGVVVGGSDGHAFRYANGVMTDIGTFPGQTTTNVGVNAIDDMGNIVGTASKDGYPRAFLYHDGVISDLGTLGGSGSTGYAINVHHQVVGQANTTDDLSYHAFLYEGTMHDLGVPDQGLVSAAYSINANGLVVGAYLTTGWDVRACILRDGSMKDLNSLVLNPSAFTIEYAYSVNDKGQIVGWGKKDPTSYEHAFLLDPVPAGWREKISVAPSQPTYGDLPIKGPGKDGLVVVTHGWEQYLSSLLPPDVSWVDGMSNSIQVQLNDHGLGNWQVHGYKWIQGAWKLNPTDALNSAKQEGVRLGNSIVAHGWTHVHFIGHSAGAALIQAATDVIKDPISGSPTTVVHETFLDAFVGFDQAGIADYGNNADWADSYFTRDLLTSLTGPYTEGPLTHAYNIDVTQLDPNKSGIAQFRSSATGIMEPCYKTLPTHEGSRLVYLNSIMGAVTADYSGFGFPLSEEGGNWDYALTNYASGNPTPQVLGAPDPSCTSDIQIIPPSYLNTVPDFTQLPTVESTSGVIQKFTDHINLLSGSPAWLATMISTTNPVNVVSFEAEFTSTSGSEGLLTVFWDADVVGTLDERTIKSKLKHYQFRFPNASAGSAHVLGFRLDPFTNIQSVMTITNVALNQVGPSQPFSLAVAESTANGMQVYEMKGQAGFSYGIQASSNLMNWTTIAVLANTNGIVRFFDGAATNYPTRFYRATVAY